MNVNCSYEKCQAVRVNKNNTNTIEIKGQLYDAVTGELIDPEQLPQAPPVQKHPVNAAERHTPKTSQLLMRSAVTKPTPSSENQNKASADIPKSVNLTTQRQQRAQRASASRQSEQISHIFVAPSEKLATPPKDSVLETSQSIAWTAALEASTNPTKTPPKTSFKQATAPKKSTKPRRRHRALAAIPVLVVLALLVFGSRAFTTLQLKIASAKVGFSTNLPAYRPAGFTLDQMNYNSGIFASDFYAKNNQSYTITQKSTTWNTQELLANYVHLVAPTYKVIQLGTRTIYLYGDGNASWISANIWYQINSDGSLNESQIIDMANSL
jgi:hypothetical protein